MLKSNLTCDFFILIIMQYMTSINWYDELIYKLIQQGKTILLMVLGLFQDVDIIVQTPKFVQSPFHLFYFIISFYFLFVLFIFIYYYYYYYYYFLPYHPFIWDSCVWSRPFEGNMEIKPKEIGIWDLTVNEKTIIILVHYRRFRQAFPKLPFNFLCQQPPVSM